VEREVAILEWSKPHTLHRRQSPKTLYAKRFHRKEPAFCISRGIQASGGYCTESG